MRRGWLVVPLLLLTAGWLGLLPESREIEELTLLTQLAVDREGEWTTVTALVGVRAAEGEEPELLTGRGRDLARAVADLGASPLRRPYLGQVETLLIGAGADVGPALDFVLEHGEMKTDILLYIVEGDGGRLLEVWAEETSRETRPADPDALTVGEALARLTQGRPLRAPALKLDERGRVVRGEGRTGETA